MIIVEPFKGKSVTEQRVEIVERKGVGHPDYMCDSMMDAISVALSQEYIKEFGMVLHHNIDKGLLAAGRTKKDYGDGKVIKPMELYIGDRATFKANGKKIPVAEIAIEAAKQWLINNLRFVDPDQHMKYRVVLAPGSEELTDIFLRPGEIKGANDTSAAVGYAPLSPTEQVVHGLETHLNSKQFKKKFPETGEDIKVMGLRHGKKLDLTVAMPFLAQYIKSEQHYFEKKEVVFNEMKQFLEKYSSFKKIDLRLNTLDTQGRGLGGIYLSVLGTSAEDADSGQVGRGNRVNGLISLNRPLGTEAIAGKNPTSHVGKIYNVLAHTIAEEIHRGIEGVEEVYVLLLSRIGQPIDQPHMANAQIKMERGRKVKDIARQVEGIFEREFSRISRFCMDLSKGKYPIC